MRVIIILLLTFFNLLNEGTALWSESKESSLYSQDPQGTFLVWKSENGSIRMENLTNIDVGPTALKSDVTMYFYSKSNPDKPVTLNALKIDDIANTKFNSSKESVFIIHGWLNKYNSEVNNLIRNAIFKKYDVNVFVVDWRSISHKGYTIAYVNVPRIGHLIGNFINNLSKKYNYPLSQIKLVGHSLGAHIAGIAGKTTNGKLNYIMGLDPAGPLFTIKDVEHRLNKGDAQYVEVIHTCGKLLGFFPPIGDVDFYPNGGFSQPGCIIPDIYGVCSHLKAYRYYAESVASGGFTATKCSSYAEYRLGLCGKNAKSEMGGLVIGDKPNGIFYLQTRLFSPFAKSN